MVWPAVVLTVALTVVLAGSGSSPSPNRQEGNCTGVRNTITHTTATRQSPATPSSLRLRSSVPRSVLKKNPLSKKKSTTPMELFTHHSVSERVPRLYPRGPGRGSQYAVSAKEPETAVAVEQIAERVLKSPRKHGASAVRLRVSGAEREAGEMPARSRHCHQSLP